MENNLRNMAQVVIDRCRAIESKLHDYPSLFLALHQLEAALAAPRSPEKVHADEINCPKCGSLLRPPFKTVNGTIMQRCDNHTCDWQWETTASPRLPEPPTPEITEAGMEYLWSEINRATVLEKKTDLEIGQLLQQFIWPKFDDDPRRYAIVTSAADRLIQPNCSHANIEAFGKDKLRQCTDCALIFEPSEPQATRDDTWWIKRVGEFRKALNDAGLHGHYNLFQQFFGEDLCAPTPPTCIVCGKSPANGWTHGYGKCDAAPVEREAAPSQFEQEVNFQRNATTGGPAPDNKKLAEEIVAWWRKYLAWYPEPGVGELEAMLAILQRNGGGK